jgi:tRNA (guanine26-N2/guanine27-N2)-dimethyltransferase
LSPAPVALSREGRTELALPPSDSTRGPAKRRAIFYNPAMALDRDLSVSVLRAIGAEAGHPLRGWDMLAATGARGLRLWNESDALSSLDLTELDPEAYEVLRQNASSWSAKAVRTRAWDARTPHPDGPFDYVDLDPFGTPEPFLDAALRSLAPGGHLGVTATDLPVLAGVQRAACEKRYGGRSIRGYLGPESGVRILTAHLLRRAQQQGLQLRPRLAYVLGHHVRVYLINEDRSAEREGLDGIAEVPPPGYEGPPLPMGGPYGPMWTGPLFDAGLVGTLTAPVGAARPVEIDRLLERFREETRADRLYFYEPNRLARTANAQEPPSLEVFRGRITARGYAFARSHVRPSAFRTDAPYAVVLEVARGAQ